MAAGVAPRCLRGRNAVPGHEVGAQHQIIQLLAGTAGGDGLKRARQKLGLIELGRRGQTGEHRDVANVIERVAQQAVAVVLPDVARSALRAQTRDLARVRPSSSTACFSPYDERSPPMS